MRKQLNIRQYGAIEGGKHLCTKAIQMAIDDAATCGGQVYVPSGIYLTGALFLKSNTSLYLSEGAVLLGTNCEDQYPIVSGRVAGIEMDWPAAVINVRDATDVRISGPGVIDGQGEYWWEKYWGKDRRGGMRASYEKKGLRWAVDYDCFRVRNVVVLNSENINLEGFHSKRSGFWNIHICYSSNVTVREIQISDNHGPSTDGIDIDSCNHVLIEKCVISCNDDNICVKSGRDADGLRTARICENVTIQNCTIYEGEGITLGSETSGGIRNIRILNNRYKGTKNGFRLKSAKTRGGVIENITVENLHMLDVAHPFSFQFNWYPKYSYCEIPQDYKGEIPNYWQKLVQKVPAEQGIPHARNITVKNVTATLQEKYDGESEAFCIEGLEEKPLENITFEEVNIQAKKFGRIINVSGIHFNQVKIESKM
jgi:polygalacturonase